jgi:hypothetical protein
LRVGWWAVSKAVCSVDPMADSMVVCSAVMWDWWVALKAARWVCIWAVLMADYLALTLAGTSAVVLAAWMAARTVVLKAVCLAGGTVGVMVVNWE